LTLQQELAQRQEEIRRQAEFAKQKESEIKLGSISETPNVNRPPTVTNKVVIPEISPEAELKTYKAQMELDSVKEGYKNLKEREQTLKDSERELQIDIEQLAKEREKFEVEQKERMDAYNNNVRIYNQKYGLLQTKLKEADKQMEDVLTEKSQAEAVIKAQSESEKENQEKLEAYTANIEECLDVFNEISRILSRQNIMRLSNLGRILTYDMALITRMQNEKCPLRSIVDVISANIGRIDEICETLQNSNSNPALFSYLTRNTIFLTESLKINWTPTSNIELR
jgi:DNA repair exonuclease SbcCD ATPase subunit